MTGGVVDWQVAASQTLAVVVSCRVGMAPGDTGIGTRPPPQNQSPSSPLSETQTSKSSNFVLKDTRKSFYRECEVVGWRGVRVVWGDAGRTEKFTVSKGGGY